MATDALARYSSRDGLQDKPFAFPRMYPKQCFALEASAQSWGQLPVWAQDITADMKKQYFACTYQGFLQLARANPNHANYYELLASANERRTTGQTDAYFDFEYNRQCKTVFPDDAELVRRLETDLRNYISRAELPEPRFYWAFASNSDKFSAHVRIVIQGHAFAGPESVGAFFHGMFNRTEYSWHDDADRLKNVIDSDVYTLNRVFRVAFATKFGSSRAMIPREVSEAKTSAGWILDERAFLDMLLQRSSTLAMSIIDLVGKKLADSELEFLVGPAQFSSQHSASPRKRARDKSAPSTPALENLVAAVMHDISSTQPWLDCTLDLTHAARDDDQRNPNGILFFYCNTMLSCLQIGRPHLHNHIRFSAHIHPGNCWFSQSCFDSEAPCAGNSSNGFPLLTATPLADAWLAESGSTTAAARQGNRENVAVAVPTDCMF